MLTSDRTVLPTATLPPRPSLEGSKKARNSSYEWTSFGGKVKDYFDAIRMR